MLIQTDCIPCLLKTSLSCVRKVTNDRATIEEFLKKILEIDALRGLKWDITTPEVMEMIALEYLKIDNNPDPFFRVKEEQNKSALELYPWMKELVGQSANPFSAALKLSIAGNLIDTVIDGDVSTVKEKVEGVLAGDLTSEELVAFWQKIESSKMILYLGDNSGEIVFDRVLIEFIKERTKADVIFVVRSEPVLNDVTLKEAFAVGMDSVARIMENGISGPVPGTIISRCSSRMREAYRKADLVISKGGGNYESLMAYSENTKDTTFLTIAKCLPYCRRFGINLDDPILDNIYH